MGSSQLYFSRRQFWVERRAMGPGVDVTTQAHVSGAAATTARLSFSLRDEIVLMRKMAVTSSFRNARPFTGRHSSPSTAKTSTRQDPRMPSVLLQSE